MFILWISFLKLQILLGTKNYAKKKKRLQLRNTKSTSTLKVGLCMSKIKTCKINKSES